MAKSGSMMKILGAILGVVVLVGLCGLGTCTVCAGGMLGGVAEVASDVAEGIEEQERDEAQAAEEATRTENAALPWLSTVRENCQRYDAAPNDIQKSAIFQENDSFVVGQRLENVRATLGSLSTAHGGGGLLLSVEVGNTHFTEGGIEEQDALYAQASNLVERSCVVVSAEVTSTSPGGFERGRVCDFRYSVEFSSIETCAE